MPRNKGNKTLEELQSEQTVDVETAWEVGKMFTKDVSDVKRRVVIMVGGRVADDFYATVTDDSAEPIITEINALFSMKGDRKSERDLKGGTVKDADGNKSFNPGAGFSKPKTVRYNAITREIVV